jgi:hypothetical protein
MNEQASNRDAIILGLSIIILILLGFSGISAQDITPTPTPQVSDKVTDELKPVDDTQKVQPEN